jgi:LPXTG-motif cell wall-anchored protein
VAVSLARVHELQLWIGGAVLLVAAGWLVVLWRRRRRG